MEEDFNKKLSVYNITARDFGILSTVNCQANLTQKEIGEKMHTDRTTMVQLIDALEEKGYLSRKINLQDRRQNFIQICEPAKEILDKMQMILSESEHSIIRDLTEFQTQVILDIAELLTKTTGDNTMNQKELLENQIEATISPMDYLAFSKENPNTAVLIDVRNAPPHLKKEKIKGALEIPLNELEQHLSELPKDKLIVVYCWDVWCNMAKKASLVLIEHGYQVKELSGGIAAWTSLNLPVESLI
jgi:rhodanese-related sulfurtransferase/DNA-binding MarR family transcriptional regulator